MNKKPIKPSRIKYLLRELLLHYSRPVLGHTTLLLEGVKHYDRPHMMVVPLINDANRLQGGRQTKAVSLDQLHSCLAGSKLPLAWDNAALQQVVREALHEIQRLESKLISHGIQPFEER